MRIGKFFGIPIELHSSFILLIAVIALVLAVFSPDRFTQTLLLLFFLFLSVLLHELCHSIVATELGYKVHKIILLPIGGVAMTETMPKKPKEEFLVAIAGPAFNFIVVLAVLFAVAAFNLPFPKEIAAEKLEEYVLNFPLFGLVWVNFILGAFNLFTPALPLDGGRVFRAILAKFVGFNRATKMVGKVSSFVAIALFLAGILYADFIIAIIAVFIYLGSKQETENVSVSENLEKISVSGIVRKKPFLVKGSETVEKAFEKMLELNETAALVKLGKGFGVLTLEGVRNVPETRRWDTPAEKACFHVPAVARNADAAALFSQANAKSIPLFPVAEKGRLFGVVFREDLEKLYALRLAANSKK